jgi:putative DNA primase/helicase
VTELVNSQQITKVFLENDLYLLPLHSIKEDLSSGKTICSCQNSKCSSPGKHPFFKYNWKIVATNDPQRISTWLTTYKDKINFAVATGRKSRVSGKYLVVVDVDKFDHPIIDKLDKTFYYKTGSGGFHFWYWSDFPVKNSVSGLASKVDIRGKDGYVVVPPSKHKSGDLYSLCADSIDIPIASLPQFIVDHIKSSKHKEVIKSKKSELKTYKSSSDESLWAKMSITEIRNLLTDDLVRIPCGTRNSVIHRLLSSDRTKGLGEEQLMTLAKFYKSKCEKPMEVNQTELFNLVSSVMHYAPYNTSYENVNQNFFEWKVKKNQGLSSTEKQNILDADEWFFSSINKSNTTTRVPLSAISNARNNVFSQRGIKSHSKYRAQLLAKKLESLGFTRTRTNKGNLWNIDLSGLHRQECMLE